MTPSNLLFKKTQFIFYKCSLQVIRKKWWLSIHGHYFNLSLTFYICYKIYLLRITWSLHESSGNGNVSSVQHSTKAAVSANTCSGFASNVWGHKNISSELVEMSLVQITSPLSFPLAFHREYYRQKVMFMWLSVSILN